MPDYQKLPARAGGELIHAVIETPRGSRVKFKYEPSLRAFMFSRTLTLGLAYPYDWGFVPSTMGEDGDPVDVMVLHEAKTAPGIVIRCRPIGVLEVLQKEGRKKEKRNDRIFAVPDEQGHKPLWNAVAEVPSSLRLELEGFFVATAALQDKRLRFVGWRGSEVAMSLIGKSEVGVGRES